jgi:hypothetical protein
MLGAGGVTSSCRLDVRLHAPTDVIFHSDCQCGHFFHIQQTNTNLPTHTFRLLSMTTNKHEDDHVQQGTSAIMMSRRRDQQPPDDTESLSRLVFSFTSTSNIMMDNNNHNRRQQHHPEALPAPTSGGRGAGSQDVIEIVDRALAILDQEEEEQEGSGNTSQQARKPVSKPSTRRGRQERPGQ